MAEKDLRTIAPPSGVLPIYHNCRLYIGDKTFGKESMEAWFGEMTTAQADEAQVYRKDEWYDVWTSSDGDELFPNYVMGIDEVSKALVSKEKDARYFLDQGQSGRFDMIKQCFLGIRSGRFGYREAEGGEAKRIERGRNKQIEGGQPKHVEKRQKRKRPAKEDGRGQCKQARSADHLGKYDLQQQTQCEHDQDDEEPSPAIKQETQTPGDPYAASTSDQAVPVGHNIISEQTSTADHEMSFDTTVVSPDATAEHQEARGRPDDLQPTSTPSAKATPNDITRLRDDSLTIGTRWVQTIGERHIRDVHLRLVELWTARTSEDVVTASVQLLGLLRCYRDSLIVIVTCERKNLDIARATGVTTSVTDAHAEAVRQYDAQLGDLEGDLGAMGSSIKKLEGVMEE